MADFEPINVKRGFLPLIILSLLSQQDMYGYQLVQEIARQSEGKFLTKEGSLYPVLYKLLEEEYITSYEVKSGVRMRRYFYRLEDKGRDYLSVLKEQYVSLTAGIQNILNQEHHQLTSFHLLTIELQHQQQKLILLKHNKLFHLNPTQLLLINHF